MNGQKEHYECYLDFHCKYLYVTVRILNSACFSTLYVISSNDVPSSIFSNRYVVWNVKQKLDKITNNVITFVEKMGCSPWEKTLGCWWFIHIFFATSSGIDTKTPRMIQAVSFAFFNWKIKHISQLTNSIHLGIFKRTNFSKCKTVV